MRVLVTGSSGFIARSLIRRLLQDGHSVDGLDIIETKKESFAPAPTQNFRALVVDISDTKTIDPDYGAEWWNQIDCVFHFAAMANVDEVREKREKAFQVNLHGTFNIAEICRKHNIPLLFASTACVYGNTSQHPSTEDGPTFPVDWYGVTKRAGEELIKGLVPNYVIMRFGTTYGPEMRDALCTHIFLKQAIQGKLFTIRGNGEQTRNWIYIDDLIDGCIRAMNTLCLVSKCTTIVNLTGTHIYSVRELASICAAVAKTEYLDIIDYHIQFLSARPDDVMREDISNKRAKELLGWTPETKLFDGMKKIFEEWKKNGKYEKLKREE